MSSIIQTDSAIRAFRITKDEFKTVEGQRRLAYIDGLLDAGQQDEITDWQRAQQAQNVRDFATVVAYGLGNYVLQTMIGVMDRFSTEVHMYQNDVYKHFFRAVRDELYEDSCCTPFVLTIRHMGAERTLFPKEAQRGVQRVQSLERDLAHKVLWVGYTDGFEWWETPARTLEGVLAHAASHSPWPIMPNTYFVEPPSLA
jgi:hypothetical protein